jgi:hypothetical protein
LGNYYSAGNGEAAEFDAAEIAFACFSRIALSTHHLKFTGRDNALAQVFLPLGLQPLDDEYPFAFQLLEHRRNGGPRGVPQFNTVVRVDSQKANQVIRLWTRLERIAAERNPVRVLWHVGCYCVGR